MLEDHSSRDYFRCFWVNKIHNKDLASKYYWFLRLVTWKFTIVTRAMVEAYLRLTTLKTARYIEIYFYIYITIDIYSKLTLPNSSLNVQRASSAAKVAAKYSIISENGNIKYGNIWFTGFCNRFHGLMTVCS